MPRELPSWGWLIVGIVVFTAIVTGALITALMPTLAKYALARPNARSSHKVPTPQGGGIAIVAVVVATMMIASLMWATLATASTIAVLATATVGLAVVGAIDDIITLPARPRLALQLLAALAVLLVLPETLRIAPTLPLFVERGILVLALGWFINLVNFMDGLDWLTVVELVPVCTGIVIFAALGEVPAFAGVSAAALLGGTLGFAPFNRPVARLFLGDVGSLSIGLVLGWLLVVVAGSGHLVAAIVLPMYYLADATITLCRRFARGERVWEAHRTHFYQRATDNGFTVVQVDRSVLIANVLLLGIAIVSVRVRSTATDALSLLAAGAVVSALLVRMSRRRQ